MVNLHVPAAPLLAYVARLPGGIVSAPGLSSMWISEEIRHDDGTVETQMTRVMTPEEGRKYKTAQVTLQRARALGTLTYKAADEFCCKVLHLHPCEVWPEWFNLDAESADELVAA